MASWTETALHALLPRACVCCRADLPLGEAGPLCAACGAALPPPPRPACARCGGALGARRDFCGACAGRLFACRLIRARASHRGPASALVHAFKFRGLPSAARDAGRRMAAELPRLTELSGFDAVAPVPLHPARRRARGYNQAELLAREVAASAGTPLLDALERRGADAPSWTRGREERRARLSGAFVAGAGADRVAGRRILLVDDVCATATTLDECALALRRAGAADVAGYAFTRAGRVT